MFTSKRSILLSQTYSRYVTEHAVLKTISHNATGLTWPSILSVMYEPHWQFNYERTRRSHLSRPEPGHVLRGKRYHWPPTRPCQSLHRLPPNMLKMTPLKVCPAPKPKHAGSGTLRCTARFVKKKHSDLFGYYLLVSLHNRYAQALRVRGGRHQLFTVCVFFSITQLQ